MRLLLYTKYRLALGAGLAFLAASYASIVLLQNDTSIAMGFLILVPLVWGYAFTLRCPNCQAGLMSTNRERIQHGKTYQCVKCAFDLRSADKPEFGMR